ncbi:hypothetical protein CI765_16215, partial [Shigella sonnei]
ELRLPDHRFRWKHNKLFLLLPVGYGPAFPAIVACYTSPPHVSVASSSLFMVLASPSDVFISGQPLYGHFCAVCNTRRIYTFPHGLSTS